MGLSVLSLLLNSPTWYTCTLTRENPSLESFSGTGFPLSAKLSTAKVVIIFYTAKYLKKKKVKPHHHFARIVTSLPSNE